MAAYGVVATLLVDRGELVEHLVAGAGAFAFLLAAALAYPRGMGMGDVKLAGAMGLYLGVAVIPALLMAFLRARSSGRHDRARGRGGAQEGRAVRHFLAIGGIVGVLAGAELMDVYRDEFPRIAAEQSGWCPASLDISSRR